MHLCPCCSGKDYSHCCGPFISGKRNPLTPEALMRSRYTAYTQANIDYIAQTMKDKAAQDFNLHEARDWALRAKWEKLQIIKTHLDPQDSNIGFVEFIAYLSEKGKQKTLYETSEFHRENNRWFYVDGKKPHSTPLIKPQKIGRNDFCPCGSGKKYKKCCGK